MRRTQELQDALGLRHEPQPFRSLELARRHADGCWKTAGKTRWIVQGDYDAEADEGVFWVVCPRDAERLIRAGYELAPIA